MSCTDRRMSQSQREAIMSGIDVQVTIGIFIVLAAGIFAGIIVFASIAYRREDRRGSITGPAPDPLCRGARRLTGVGTIGSAGWFLPGPRTGDEAARPTGAGR